MAGIEWYDCISGGRREEHFLQKERGKCDGADRMAD